MICARVWMVFWMKWALKSKHPVLKKRPFWGLFFYGKIELVPLAPAWHFARMKIHGATLGCWLRTLWYVPLWRLAYKVWRRLKGFYYTSPLYGLKDEALHVREGVREDFLSPLDNVPYLWPGSMEAGREIAAGRWTFIGQTYVPNGLMDWAPAGRPLLWIFHLHYHDWLGDLRAAGQKQEAQKLLADWMRECGHYHPTAWHPYPLSLRIVNWLVHAEWLLKGWNAKEQLAFREILTRQISFLEHNLEWDLGYNHLLKNLKALIFAGVAVPGADALLVPNLARFVREIKSQTLPDGGHAERSPSYLKQVLEDVVDVVALLRPVGGAPLPLIDAMEAMATALATLRHPDGGLALFNDGEVEEAAHVERVLRHAWHGEDKPYLPDTGYVRLARGGTCVLMDVGLVGPDDNPGHAHADTLSFEMSAGTERIFVNGGTFGYQTHDRNMMRGTCMHNTVTVDGMDSSEVWGGFRVGRRVRRVIHDIKGLDKPGADVVLNAEHDGYRHLGVRHQRKMMLAGDGSVLQGEDSVLDKKGRRRRCEAAFLVHPQVSLVLEDEGRARLTTATGKEAVFEILEGRLAVKNTVYCPFFGQKIPTKKLIIQGYTKGDGRWCVRWKLRFLV